MESSTDFNSTMQRDKRVQLSDMTQKAQDLLEEIQSSLTTQDATNIIDELIKNKMVEIENLQYETNLKMYEEYNFLLMSKIKKLHAVLDQHNVNYDASTSDDEDGDEEEEYDFRNIDGEFDLQKENSKVELA